MYGIQRIVPDHRSENPAPFIASTYSMNNVVQKKPRNRWKKPGRRGERVRWIMGQTREGARVATYCTSTYTTGMDGISVHEWKINNGATKKWGTVLETKEGGNSDEQRELDISNRNTLKSSSHRRTLGEAGSSASAVKHKGKGRIWEGETIPSPAPGRFSI